MGLYTLQYASQLRRALLLWPIRLVIHPAKVPVPVQRGHLLKRQSCVLPISAVATAAVTPNLACQLRGGLWFPHSMRRRFFVEASTFALATGPLILTSCSTPQTRISEHRDLYHSLSHRDQALVGEGQVRIGMSRTAVWLAWGSPDRKIVGNMSGGATETWLYIYYAPYYPPYAPWGPWAYFGDPFYDPFYYSYIPPSIPYPGKVVTFAKSRVVSFQYVAPH